MPSRDLSNAIFEVKDKKRSSRSKRRSYTPKPQNPTLFKRRAFDTFYLFGVVLLILAIAVQIVALGVYS